jgi:mannose-1-phosphate guanylyltransferase/mannose-6-phosphate isomerase
VARGAPAAAKGAIVAFGVRPTAPHTGYGYIEAGAAIDDGVCEVAAFREKPDRQTAEHYLRTGRYSWNAGIFLFGPSVMTAELDRFAPAIARGAAAALAAAAADGTTLLLDPSRFAECPSDSIDYAVMEKTRRAAMVGPIDIGWSDIGSWAALPGAADARIVALDCAGASIRTDGPLVAAVGVEDLIIIAAADAVLVAPKNRAEDVKRIVEELKVRKRGDLL